MTDDKSHVFSFADYEVRERDFLIVKAGSPTPVEPRTFLVLLYLLRNPNRLVTKDEIIEAVWSDYSVSDNSLTRSIAQLRRILGDDISEPVYIATVRTLGYRFLRPVRSWEDLAPSTGLQTSLPADLLLQAQPKPFVRRRPIVTTLAVVSLAAAAGLAVLIGWKNRANSLQSQPSGFSSESRLTSRRHDLPITSSSLSPDARYVAFTDPTGLYLLELAGSATHPLGLSAAFASAHVESWFPDNTHFVISSWAGDAKDPQSLWKTSILGGTPTLIIENGWSARVSPDGRSLALKRFGAHGDVYLADIDSSARRLSTPHRLNTEHWSDAVHSWTPDSKEVLFTSDRDGHQHVFRQAIDGTRAELLTPGAQNYAIPRMSSDARKVLYLRLPSEKESSQDVEIVEAQLAGGPSRVVLKAPAIWNHQCAGRPSVCVFSADPGGRQKFFLFDPASGHQTEILSGKVNDAEWSNWSLSPDGKFLAVGSLKEHQDATVLLISISGQSEKVLPLSGWPSMNGITWAADGKSLLVAACTGRTSAWGEPDTCTILNVGLDRKITPLIADRDVRFFAAIPSPDGKHVALAAETGEDANVWLVTSSE